MFMKNAKKKRQVEKLASHCRSEKKIALGV